MFSLNRRFSCSDLGGFLLLCAAAAALTSPVVMMAQPPPISTLAPGAARDQLMARLIGADKGAWTAEQLATMAKLRDAAIADPYALNELRHLTDNIGPRLSGSPQAQAAVEYVAAEMKALGAEVTLEKTSVPHWIRGTETGALVVWPGMTAGTTQKIVLTALGGSETTPADGITAEVVVVKDWQQLKAMPPEAFKGKILLLNHEFDKQLAAQIGGGYAYGDAVPYRVAAPIVGATVGAAAVLVRSVGGADYRIPHTGMTAYQPGLPRIPAAAVTAEDADLLANLTSQGPVKMHLTLVTQTLPDAPSYNVIADWKGTEHPEQVVIVSGHLDSWDLGTGAIDDGAGVVVSMQAIHLLSKLGIHPKRTVRFIAWMSEEEGAMGGATYTAEHAGDVANHIGAIESDMGAGHPDGILFTGKPELAAWLMPVEQALDPIGAKAVRQFPETGEDIAGLTEKGVPSFAPSQDGRYYFNYHHTPADTFDKVNPRELSENAAVMTVLSYALADSAEKAPR
jgi:Zn-dependent M28 family amino/carboxypeptidase